MQAAMMGFCLKTFRFLVRNSGGLMYAALPPDRIHNKTRFIVSITLERQ